MPSYHPIQRTKTMASIHLRYDKVGSAIEIARYIAAALQPFGVIKDIVLCIRSINSLAAEAKVLLDRTDNTVTIPAVLLHDNKRMTLLGNSVAPYCIYCKEEGHVKLKCGKWLRRQEQDKGHHDGWSRQWADEGWSAEG
ncbi:hypothetical protein H4R19_003555 [Coemansia spiralis]|nr:hypothetical protein H4R19_003555 [Coemansia spiralis]